MRSICGLGSEAPPLRKVTGILERISEVVVSFGGVVPAGEEGGADADQMQDQVAASGDAGAATGSRTGGSPGKIITREDALREMDRIAEFFKRTEPHSPSPIRWRKRCAEAGFVGRTVGRSPSGRGCARVHVGAAWHKTAGIGLGPRRTALSRRSWKGSFAFPCRSAKTHLIR